MVNPVEIRKEKKELSNKSYIRQSIPKAHCKQAKGVSKCAKERREVECNENKKMRRGVIKARKKSINPSNHTPKPV